MVKKLFKHEFLFYARVMPIIYGILLTIAVATSIIFAFPSYTSAYEIVSIFSAIIYSFSVIAAFGFSFVMGIVRFYKNMFTSEGYLTLTLPVTATQHILVKAVTALSVSFITIVMVLISSFIVYGGKGLTEIFEGFGYIFSDLIAAEGVHIVLFICEFVILSLISSFGSILLYYTFISIGQLFKKNRILAAVGAYFVYYIGTQIIATILTISLSVLATSGAFYDIGYWIAMHPMEAIHIFLCSTILLSAVFTAIEFLIVRWVITKKLNLE